LLCSQDEGTLDNTQYKDVKDLIAITCDSTVPHLYAAPLVAGIRPVYCIPTTNISTVLELMQSIQYLTGVGEMRVVGHGGDLDGEVKWKTLNTVASHVAMTQNSNPVTLTPHPNVQDLDEEMLLVQYNIKPGQVFFFVDLYGNSQL